MTCGKIGAICSKAKRRRFEFRYYPLNSFCEFTLLALPPHSCLTSSHVQDENELVEQQSYRFFVFKVILEPFSDCVDV